MPLPTRYRLYFGEPLRFPGADLVAEDYRAKCQRVGLTSGIDWTC